jgi:hypothetical protein
MIQCLFGDKYVNGDEKKGKLGEREGGKYGRLKQERRKKGNM